MKLKDEEGVVRNTIGGGVGGAIAFVLPTNEIYLDAHPESL
ncbi:MAG: hypothetical protein ACFB4I_16465 [Cyanophyceae cyanobacterium]